MRKLNMVVRVLGRAVAMSQVGIVAAVLGMLATPAPAAADTCGPGAGVSVVVDFRELGGGLQTLCDAGGGGKSAAALFSDNGYALTYATQQPGFVCRVSGLPASDPCVHTSPTTAYWGLYWSDGSNGSWAYASRAADSLVVPAGGSVAFAWQGSGQRGVPAVDPPAAAASPTPTTAAPTTTAPSPTSPTTSTSGTTKPSKTPTKKATTKPTTTPTKQPTSTPTSTGTSSATTPPPSPTESSSTADPSESSSTEPPSESPSESPSSSCTDSPTASATEDPSETATTESTPPSAVSDDSASRTEQGSNRVPTWLTLTILASLLVAIGMSTYAARRRTRH